MATTRQTIVCVKRKRGEEPISGIVIEDVPAAKRFETLSISDKAGAADAPVAPLVAIKQHFTLVSSMSSRDIQRPFAASSIETAIEQMRQQRREKLGKTRLPADVVEKMNTQAKTARLKQMTGRRYTSGANLTKKFTVVEFEQAPSTSDPVADAFEQATRAALSMGVEPPPQAYERPLDDNDYEYDVYYLDDNAPEEVQQCYVSVKMESHRWTFDNEYDGLDSDHDSSDENAEDRPGNDYGDTDSEQGGTDPDASDTDSDKDALVSLRMPMPTGMTPTGHVRRHQTQDDDSGNEDADETWSNAAAFAKKFARATAYDDELDNSDTDSG
eukprot:TRINITY_DN11426_c0_g1_i1.p1 TRINITY_DN11426_c0_g1~~TRINITY_DN11426_c0_g1_i1.p1  ORF type:complete len:339 (+),score=78.90 TRINITY_DN11426_c0_g1_i1:34-1017(+)